MKTTLIALLVAGLLLAGCSSQGNSSTQGQGSGVQQETPQSQVQATGSGTAPVVAGPAPDPQLLGSIDSTAQDLNSGLDSTALDDNGFLQVDNSTFQ